MQQDISGAIKAQSRFSTRQWLLALLLVAFLLRISVAMREPNIVHPDETFQTLEPAHRLAYGYGVVTWEWRDGVRSWVFPSFLAGIMRASDWAGNGSAGYLAAIKVVLSLISLTTVWFGFVWANRVGGLKAGILAGGMCAVWYELVIFAARPLNEVVAAHLLLPGIYLGAHSGQSQKRRLFVAGFLCGTALSFRLQLAPAIAFVGLYFCRSNWKQKVGAVITGFLVPVLLFGLLDVVTWQYPFQSFVRYFWANIVEGRAQSYGVEPWYWYLALLAAHLGPVLFLALLGASSSSFLSATAFIVVASHSMIAHKEPRFIYPALPLIITSAGLGIVEVANKLQVVSKSKVRMRTTLVVGMILFALTSSLLARRFAFLESGTVSAFDQLSSDLSVCGVGLYGVPWFYSGGYAHLHRNIPIVLMSKPFRLEEDADSVNAVIGVRNLPVVIDSFKMTRCWNFVCLYRRPGTCVAPRKGEINAAIRQNGQ